MILIFDLVSNNSAEHVNVSQELSFSGKFRPPTVIVQVSPPCLQERPPSSWIRTSTLPITVRSQGAHIHHSCLMVSVSEPDVCDSISDIIPKDTSTMISSALIVHLQVQCPIRHIHLGRHTHRRH